MLTLLSGLFNDNYLCMISVLCNDSYSTYIMNRLKTRYLTNDVLTLLSVLSNDNYLCMISVSIL